MVEISEGPHLGYALQWFTFAGIFLFGYPFYVKNQLATAKKESISPKDDYKVKFSLKSPFARLSLLVLLLVFISDIIGRISYLNDAAISCVGWPICSPQGINGWLEILHRAAILVSSFMVIFLWQQAWKKYRDHTVLLPLSTLVLVFFYSNVFIGAIEQEASQLLISQVLHSLTAVIMWISLFATTIASGFYSNMAIVEFPPVKFRQRIRDLFTLTKPIVVSLLLVTTFGGMVAGSKSLPPFWLIVWTLAWRCLGSRRCECAKSIYRPRIG